MSLLREFTQASEAFPRAPDELKSVRALKVCILPNLQSHHFFPAGNFAQIIDTSDVRACKYSTYSEAPRSLNSSLENALRTSPAAFGRLHCHAEHFWACGRCRLPGSGLRGLGFRAHLWGWWGDVVCWRYSVGKHRYSHHLCAPCLRTASSGLCASQLSIRFSCRRYPHVVKV